MCACVCREEGREVGKHRRASEFAHLVMLFTTFIFQESKIDEHHFVAVALRKPDGSRHQGVRF